MTNLINDLKEMLVDRLEYAYIEGDSSKEFQVVLNEELTDLIDSRDDLDIQRSFNRLTERDLQEVREDVLILVLKWYELGEIEATKYHDIIVNVAHNQEVYKEYFNKIV